MCMPAQIRLRLRQASHSGLRCFTIPKKVVPCGWPTYTQFLMTSHSFSQFAEKDTGCQPGDSFRAGSSVTNLKLLLRTLHCLLSADQHVRPHDVSIYAPGSRIPHAMGHWRVAQPDAVQ
eukprot:95198-Chlamydomonas_euryale.AAC.4